MRQQPLFDEQDGVLRAIKGDGAIMPGAAADGDVHKIRRSGAGVYLAGKQRIRDSN